MTTQAAYGASGVPRVRVEERREPLPAAPPERELKFLVAGRHVAFVAGLLRGVCPPESRYPPARIVTVYFDTPGLQLLDEKINSDYLKTKVRVRWYEALDGSASAGDAAFVEAKCRIGSTREKRRLWTARRAADLAALPLDAAEWGSLVAALRLEGAGLPHDLAPVLRLSYVRERLVDRLGGGRVSLDTGIAVTAVNPQRIRPGRIGQIPGAVVEYKGQRSDLPPHLRLLTAAGLRRASYSKYLAAYLHVTGTIL
jgi:hypothetical protein